jgi:hypothetical protein
MSSKTKEFLHIEAKRINDLRKKEQYSWMFRFLGFPLLLLVAFSLLLVLHLTRDKTKSSQISELPHFESKQSIEFPKENFEDYINSIQPKTDLSVIIVDESGNISTSLSSSIAKIYSKAGFKTSSSFLRSNFINTPHFVELFEGDSKIIDSLQLHTYVDYLVIGKVSFKPSIASDMKVYNAAISVSIISATKHSIQKAFTVDAYGNGFDDNQAKETAIRNAIDKYTQNFSSIN